MKNITRFFAMFMAVVLLFGAVFPAEAFAAGGSKTYKRVGNAYPDIVGLGATDTVSFTVSDGKITNVMVSQKGGSMLGVVSVTPAGYYLKSGNIVVCNWKLTWSLPFKIFNIGGTIKSKTIRYQLGTDGSMRIV